MATKPDQQTLRARAQQLQQTAIVIDGHNDHFDAKRRRGDWPAFMKVNRCYHSDGARLLQAGFTATCFYVGGNDLRQAMNLVSQVWDEIDGHDELLAVRRSPDIRRAHREKKLGVIMIWEGAEALQGTDMALVHLVHRLGVRAVGLTHPGRGGQDGKPYALQGTPSFFGYCTAEDRASFRRTCQGLTDFGKEVVRTLNRLGMVVDVAHANDAAFEEVLELSSAPVMFSHGGVFACCPHARGLTDEQIQRLAAQGGVMGVAFYDKFLARDRKASVADIADQICHVAELVGVRHVGLGSDFDGLPRGVWPVIRGPERLPRLIETLLQRGFNDTEMRGILGGNFLRVFKTVWG